MARVEKADYVLVALGRVIAASNDMEELKELFITYQLPDGAIKPFRLHTWIAGIPNSIFSDEHCVHCKATRQRKGTLDDQPCKYPERGDVTLEIYEHHAAHTPDRCCPQHNHHAKNMHVNCMLR